MNKYKIAISRYQLDKKIPHGSDIWPRFNASFDNVEIGTNEIMDNVFEGRSITTQHSNNWRKADNYLFGQHIGLDFDNMDETASMAYLMKDKFITKYASFIHTTMSHEPEAPRFRVMFLLDTPIVQAANYALSASALLWLFGTADRQCKDAARFFYGSPKCDMEFIGHRLPIDVLKKLIKNYKESGQKARKQAGNQNYTVPTSQQEVNEALKLIPPWTIAYDDWLAVLMGIHSEFGEGGYNLAESWAQGKKGEVSQKWKSFDKSGNVQGAVTVATIFGIAKRFGWTKAKTVV